MESLTLIAPDRIGLLLEVTEVLGRGKINIESISLEVVGKKAMMRIMVEEARIRTAKELLARHGFKVVESDTLVLKVKDRAGELAKVAKILTDAGIKTESLQVIEKQNGEMLNSIRVSNPEKARKLLEPYI